MNNIDVQATYKFLVVNFSFDTLTENKNIGTFFVWKRIMIL